MKQFLRQNCSLMLLFMTFVSLILLGSQVQATPNNANPSVEFSDNGTLTLTAEAVPLETLLEKIQEQSVVEFEIPKRLLRQPISVSFKSLPLDKAIRRVLRGVSYSCIFDSNGNIEKIIALPSASKDKDTHIARRASRLDLQHERAMEITPPPETEDIMEAMESMSSPELEDLDEAVEVTPPPEVVKSLVEAIEAEGVTPPPELEELMGANEIMPTPQVEDMDAALETRRPPKVVKDLIELLRMRE